MKIRLLSLIVLAGAVATGVPRAVQADAAATASPTPSPSPLATGTPVTPPSLSEIETRSFTAMTTVRQLHADGVVADGPKSVGKGVHLTADCDLTARKERFRLESVDPSNPRFIEFVLFKNAAWYRTSEQPAWVLDTQADVDILIPFAFPACPIAYISRTGGLTLPAGAKAHQSLVGQEMLDGVRVWHTRLSTKMKRGSFRLDWYVEGTTYYWVRMVGRQTKPNEYFDMRYSHFNEPVAIPLPKVGDTP